MGAAVIGVVEEVCVAGLETAFARDLVDDRFHREGHRADEDRQTRRALYERRASLSVIEPVACVARLRDDRIEGRAIERCVHFVGDLLKPPVQYRKGHGIKRAHRVGPAFRSPLS